MGKNDFSLLFLFYFVVVLQERFHCIKKSASTPGLNDIISGSCHKCHFCRDKSMLAETKLLSRQTFFARIFFVATKLYFRLDKHTFVAAKDVFCLDKIMCVATKEVFCRDKHVALTKITLVAAPANDTTKGYNGYC